MGTICFRSREMPGLGTCVRLAAGFIPCGEVTVYRKGIRSATPKTRSKIRKDMVTREIYLSGRNNKRFLSKKREGYINKSKSIFAREGPPYRSRYRQLPTPLPLRNTPPTPRLVTKSYKWPPPASAPYASSPLYVPVYATAWARPPYSVTGHWPGPYG